MDEFSGDDIPPLEDMSGVLKQTKQIQRQKEMSSSSVHQSSSSSTNKTPLHPAQAVANGNASPPNNASMGKSETANAKEAAHITKPSGSTSAGFGGMQKGFLFGGPSQKSNPAGKPSATPPRKPAAQTADPGPAGGKDIPLIRPEGGAGDGKERYRIQEVQEAMAATAPLLQNKEWVNDDLLSRLTEHPRLAQQMTDPRFAQAVQKFQSNPQLAVEEYRDDAQVQQFFKDFCALLGNHFASIGETSPTSAPTPGPPPDGAVRTRPPGRPDIQVRSSSDPKQATAADEAKMQQILADPAIREVLMDGRVQTLMEALRTDPDQGQRILRSADPSLQGKIHKLVEAGLLGFA